MAVVMAVVIVCTSISMNVYAEQASVETLEETTDDFEIDGTTLVKYTGSESNVTIPEGITIIGESAFSYCTSLEAVSIPSGVESIGRYAFESCANLKTVTIPSDITSIAPYAFYCCTGLESIEIPDGITKIEEGSFSNCTKLSSIQLPEGLTEIGDKGFASCNSLSNIELPSGLTHIGNSAFELCSSMEKITIGASVASIGDGAFSYCTQLTDINVSGENTKYSAISGVLFNKEQTVLLTFPAGKEGSYTVPSSVTGIGDAAFFWCEKLSAIDLSANVTSIGADAFFNCTGLKNVQVGAGLTSIGARAFYACKSLTDIDLSSAVESIEESTFFNCTSLENIVLPSGIKSIGSFAFCLCANLTELTIPQSTASLGDCAFGYCTGLTKVEVYSDSVAFVGDPFYETGFKGNFYANAGSNTMTYAIENAFSFRILDKTVKELSVIKAGNTSIKVSWSEVSEAAGYEICYTVEPSDTEETISDITSNSYTHTNLTSGQTYSYKVRCYVLINDEKYYGDFTEVMPLTLPVPKPANLSAKVASASSIKLSWKETEGVEGYRVYVSTKESSGYTALGNTKNTSYTCKSLKAGTTYYFKVRSHNTVSGEKKYSGYTAAKKLKLTVPAPGSFKITNSSATSVKLSWNKVSGASGYQIYRATSKNGTYKKIKTITSGSSTSCTNKSLKNGKTYYYKIRAYKTVDGNKKYSKFCDILSKKVTLGKPTVTANVKNASSITLSWKKVSGAKKYVIYRATSKNATYKKIKTVTSLSYTNTKLKSNKTYYYKIKAVQGSYKSASSTVKWAKTSK